jgi:hypothetical protein
MSAWHANFVHPNGSLSFRWYGPIGQCLGNRRRCARLAAVDDPDAAGRAAANTTAHCGVPNVICSARLQHRPSAWHAYRAWTIGNRHESLAAALNQVSGASRHERKGDNREIPVQQSATPAVHLRTPFGKRLRADRRSGKDCRSDGRPHWRDPCKLLPHRDEPEHSPTGSAGMESQVESRRSIGYSRRARQEKRPISE